VYLLIWLPVVVLSVLSIFGINALLDGLGLELRYEWLGWAFALLPPFLCGAWCYRAFGGYLQQKRTAGTIAQGHLRRSAALYAIAAILGTFVLRGLSRPEEGFGLVAPAFVWPLMATLGGILGDRLIPLRSVPQSRV
jgi:hypothetical protein